jgi:autotransporter-associated beta strand protein
MQTPSNPIRPSRIRLGNLRLSPAASLRLALPAAILGLSSPALLADNGTWAAAADGLWSDPAKWTSSTIADGSGFGADFSTVDPTSSILVNLDSPRTLSSLVFGDTATATAADWLVDNNGDPLNVLTLDGSATVTVNDLGTDAFAEISAGIAGTAGIIKEGPGTLILSGANSFTGPTTVTSGKLVQRNFATVNSAHDIASGATLEFADTSNINMAGGSFTGSGTLVKSGSASLAFGFSNNVPVQVGLGSDALIQVKEGSLIGSSYGQGQWASNQSDLQIDAGATFDSSENDARFDAVTGSGNLIGTWWGDPATIIVGVANGSGTFSGSLFQNKNVGLGLTKEGTGTQIFSNIADHAGTTTVNGGILQLPGYSNSALYTIATDATLELNRSSDQNKNIKNILINGGGDLVKKGAGLLTVNRWQNEADRSYEIALGATSEIRIEAGKLRLGDYNITWNTANNLADLHIEAGATVDGHTSGMTVDALTGGGIYESGYYGPRVLNVGVNNGSGTFSGTIRGNGLDGNSQTQFVKRGNGTQTITGKFNAGGAYGSSSLEVRGGISGTPSTLILSPTDPTSSAGYGGGAILFSPGNNDITAVQQTAGTLVGNLLAVGERGQCTYDFSGGIVNAGRLEFAWNGGGNNGPAVMNLSGSAQLNVNSNGQILMGQYWGRDITINQSGGSVVQYSDAGLTRGGTGKMRFLSANQNVTWNLSGGTLSIAGMERASGSGFGGGNGILNLNGGILQITNAAFAAPTGDANGKPVVAAKALGDDATPNSGARIDPYGLAVTFAAPVQHGGASTFDGGLSVESSLPGGSLTLAGINTYTGDTTVAAGNTLVLADNAELAFLVDGLDATKVTGPGTATFNGDFRIDTTSADATPGTEWTLVDVASRSFDAVTFSVIGFTQAADVWTKTEAGLKWTFTESTGILSVAVAPPGYTTWIGTFAVGDATAGGDPDFDGMSNLLEYVLNGDPTASDPAILPDLDASGADFVFTFHRRNESKDDTTQVFQYNEDLGATWTEIPIPAASAGAVVITPDTPEAGVDQVVVSIPKGSSPKLFGRLKATQP